MSQSVSASRQPKSSVIGAIGFDYFTRIIGANILILFIGYTPGLVAIGAGVTASSITQGIAIKVLCIGFVFMVTIINATPSTEWHKIIQTFPAARKDVGALFWRTRIVHWPILTVFLPCAVLLFLGGNAALGIFVGLWTFCVTTAATFMRTSGGCLVPMIAMACLMYPLPIEWNKFHLVNAVPLVCGVAFAIGSWRHRENLVLSYMSSVDSETDEVDYLESTMDNRDRPIETGIHERYGFAYERNIHVRRAVLSGVLAAAFALYALNAIGHSFFSKGAVYQLFFTVVTASLLPFGDTSNIIRSGAFKVLRTLPMRSTTQFAILCAKPFLRFGIFAIIMITGSSFIGVPAGNVLCWLSLALSASAAAMAIESRRTAPQGNWSAVLPALPAIPIGVAATYVILVDRPALGTIAGIPLTLVFVWSVLRALTRSSAPYHAFGNR
jgi:hypothetical protein